MENENTHIHMVVSSLHLTSKISTNLYPLPDVARTLDDDV